MGGIILVASIIVWALSYFPHPQGLDEHEQQQQSYLAAIGKTVEPVFRPQGFTWKLDVGLIAGVGAKEIVASTMGILYSDEKDIDDDNSKYKHINKSMSYDIAQLHQKSVSEIKPLTDLTAYCYLLFVLLYFPCIATIAAIKGETGSWKWALFTAGYTTCLAWAVSALVFQIGSIFI